MKLITQVLDRDEAQSIKFRLERKGIPTYIGSENSGRAVGVVIADCYTIWVEIDQQHDSAIAVLNDENYVHDNSVDVDEFRTVQEQGVTRFRNTFSKLNEYLITVAMLGIIGGFIYYAMFRL